jgi:hypothetical protein
VTGVLVVAAVIAMAGVFITAGVPLMARVGGMAGVLVLAGALVSDRMRGAVLRSVTLMRTASARVDMLAAWMVSPVTTGADRGTSVAGLRSIGGPTLCAGGGCSLTG